MSPDSSPRGIGPLFVIGDCSKVAISKECGSSRSSRVCRKDALGLQLVLVSPGVLLTAYAHFMHLCMNYFFEISALE